ncbi:MAG TPA: CvpA family protein [Terriglobales bacterium]|nr:CvpA family protein [Terriglobales bacterium]
MNLADWVIVGVVVLSVIQAASAGFFQEAFGIAGLFFGYLLAAWNYQRLAAHFGTYGAPWLIGIAAFLVIFVGVMLLAGLAGRITRWIMQEAGLSIVDRILGAGLGLLRGCLVDAIVLVSLAAFTPTSKWLQGSELAPYFLVAGRAAVWVAPAELRARFYQGLDLLRRDGQRTR